MRFSKKLLGVLACSSALAGVSVATNVNGLTPKSVVKAATSSAPARSYGVDVSSFQGADLSAHAKAGSQFAIVKVSEGTSYRNPNAAGQIASAKANNMMPMAYHFAIFGNNASAARAEANYAISSAQAYGLPKGSYIVCDWETGDGNNVSGGVTSSTNAVISFMDTIKAAGYQPMLYSGAYLLRNNVNTNTILAKYPNSLWVASYATMGRIDNPDFNYFPSMDGIAIWQFTDNWRGLYVDGNIALLPLSFNSTSQAPTNSNNNNNTNTNTNTAKPGTTSNSGSPLAKVASSNSIAVYNKANGTAIGKTLSSGTEWKVFSKQQVNGVWWYNVGGNQWINGKDLYVTGFSAISEQKTPTAPSTPVNTAKPGTTSNSGSPLAKVASSNSIAVYNKANGTAIGKTLGSGTEWKVFSKQQVNGVWWYNVGGNQWINGKDLYITGFSAISEQKTPTTPANTNKEGQAGTTSNSGSPIAKVASSNSTAVYNKANGTATGKTLSSGTEWKVFSKQQVNGVWWYNVGGNQWINGKDLYVTGFSAITVATNNSNNNSSNTNSNSNATSGIGRINYVPGYGINLWIGYGSNAKWSGRRLPHGTTWKFYNKVTANGKTWYNLGGNQWIDGSYFIVEK